MARLSKLSPSIGRLRPLVTKATANTEASRQRFRDAPWRKLYNTRRWRELRIATFVRDLFTCRLCGITHGAPSHLVCDHIKPHRGDERLFWNEANLQTLCKTCHDGVKQRAEQESLHHRGVWD